jgi:hypothetical protein
MDRPLENWEKKLAGGVEIVDCLIRIKNPILKSADYKSAPAVQS